MRNVINVKLLKYMRNNKTNLFVLGLLLISSFYSCSTMTDEIENSKIEKITKTYDENIRQNKENELQVLKFVYLKNEKYYLDKEGALKANLDKNAITSVEKSINETNKDFEEFKKEISEESLKNINSKKKIEVKTEFIDFQKINIDSLISEVNETSEKKNLLNKRPSYETYGSADITGGDITTNSTYPRQESAYNVRFNYVYFESLGFSAPVSSHRYIAQSTFGGQVAAFRTGSAYTRTNATLKLNTSGDKLFLQFSCSDPMGCAASWKLSDYIIN